VMLVRELEVFAERVRRAEAHRQTCPAPEETFDYYPTGG
jgi:hypothetical protein